MPTPITIHIFNPLLNKVRPVQFDNVGDINLIVGKNYKSEAIQAIVIENQGKSFFSIENYADLAHHSELENIWGQVSDFHRDDITFFSTTERLDVIEAFYQTSLKNPSIRFMVYNIGNDIRTSKKGEFSVLSYDMEKLSLCLGTEIEIR
jgi:hypothetical protein